jgi:hypothetical protein
VEPVSLVVAALVAGATAGVSGAASTAVGDTYAGLKRLVAARLRRWRPGSEQVLDRAAATPKALEAELVPMLTAAGVAGDHAVLTAASQVLGLTDPEGAASGKYVVDLRAAKGVQVGDYNVQHNTFS